MIDGERNVDVIMVSIPIELPTMLATRGSVVSDAQARYGRSMLAAPRRLRNGAEKLPP